LIAGTKGKGSTVAMLSACLQAAGYRTGRYTSPHLVNWRERTTIDDVPISTDSVLALVEPIHRAIDEVPGSLGPLTTFEVGTAFAFGYFARQDVDIAVVEVGTGGRFDATNLVDPLVCAITPISYDHTPTLGSTLTSIAWHKAGILRPGRPAVSAPQVSEAQTMIESEARLVDAPLVRVGRDWRWSSAGDVTRIESMDTSIDVVVGLLGDHQRDNATTTVAALHALTRFEVPHTAIKTGLSTVNWPGRLQVVAEHPLVVLDGAHNAASAEVVSHALEAVFEFDRLLLVLGLSEGKDALGVLRALAPRAERVILTRSRHERSAVPADLEPLARLNAPHAEVSIAEDVGVALESALSHARPSDMILVTGSLFLVGEGLVWWRRSHP
jgi:dihydrofolate synthase/folylpolyglutamate synthase